MTQQTNDEWTILEKLLLTQAVYKYGENMWFQVARVLKQHSLIQQQGIQRSSDFYNEKNCSLQYYLLVENMGSEKQQTSRHELNNDMPVVVRLARQLYLQRVEEIKKRLERDQEEFNQLATEICSIKSGQWDQRLTEQSTINDKLNDNMISLANNVNTYNTNIMDNDTNESTTMNEKEVYCMKRAPKESITSISHALKKTQLDKPIQQCVEAQVISTAISKVNHLIVNDIFKPSASNKSKKNSLDTNVIDPIETNKSIKKTIEQAIQIQEKNICEDEEMSEPNKEENTVIEKEIQMHQIEHQKNESKSISDDKQRQENMHTKPLSNPNNSLEDDEQQLKNWRKTIYILWQQIANSKTGTMFLNPVNNRKEPFYNKVVKRPLFLKTIKKRIREGVIKTTREFERDIVLMLTNSLMYNKEGSERYLLTLNMLEDVREQFEIYNDLFSNK